MSSTPPPGSGDPLELRGVIPPVITGFAEDGSLSTERTAAHARYVVDGGADAVFPLGTNGEFPLLGPDERVRVVEAVVEAVGDEVPVIAGVGSPGTRTTVANARRAVEAGADGVVVVTPYYYPLDGRAAVSHYRRVAESVDRPVYAYHIPSKTGNELDPETLSALSDVLAGVKDSSKDVPWLGQAIDDNPELTFLVGSDSLLFAGLSVGCSGVVSAVANVFPELVVSLYEASAEGEREEAKAIQSEVYDVRTALKRGPYMAGVKDALDLVDSGFDPGPLREPLRRMDDDQRAALRADLESLSLLPADQ